MKVKMYEHIVALVLANRNEKECNSRNYKINKRQ